MPDVSETATTSFIETRIQKYACRRCAVILAGGAGGRLIQPRNRGTAPAILYSLVQVREKDEEAIAAFFPSDHHIEDDEAFAVHMESAFVEAAHQPKSVLLIGIAPDNPEPEYGWIEPGLELGKP